jgi:acetyltransferase
VPSYDTPEQAVRACALLATYRRNQEQLMQAPPAHTAPAAIDLARVRETGRRGAGQRPRDADRARGQGVLQAAGIPVVATEVVADRRGGRGAAAASASRWC